MSLKRTKTMNNPWQCPRCSRINAPWNPNCFCNIAHTVSSFTSLDGTTKVVETYFAPACQHEVKTGGYSMEGKFVCKKCGEFYDV